MARVINLVRRSGSEFVLEEEVRPGQWVAVAGVPRAAVSPAQPRQTFSTAGAVADFFARIGSFFKPKPITVSPFELRPPGVGPPGPLVEFVEPPPAPPRIERPPEQPKLGVTPEQIARLVTETKIREAQIKNYLATPLGFVWQKSKQVPGLLTQVPVKRPTPPPGEIEALFPLPTIPSPQELAGFGPKPVRIFKGFLQVEGGRRLNLWEDFAGNEVEGFRETPGEFGEAIVAGGY